MALVKHDKSSGQHGGEANFVHSDPIVEAALEWFTRLQTADADGALRARFEAWLKRDVRHEREFRALKDIWGSKAFERAVAGLDAFDVSKTVKAERALPRRWRGRAMAAAAAVLVAAGIWQGQNIVLAWQADYLTEPGAQSVVSLPDGSRMIMNTDSAVAVDFDGGRREIRLLKGEAFFDVVHDPAHPFRVEGDYGEVEVRGTAFSVRTDGAQTAVVLERGLVDVTCLCTSGGDVELNPGQTVTVSAEAFSQVSSVDTDRVLAWRDGRISFNDAPLGKVVSELSRYYRGRVLVTNSRIEQFVISGNYRLDNIEGAIRTLADAAGVGMTRLPGGIIILR